jgi:hypothetical protein
MKIEDIEKTGWLENRDKDWLKQRLYYFENALAELEKQARNSEQIVKAIEKKLYEEQ